MTSHDAVKMMVEIYRLLSIADNHSTNVTAIDNIRTAMELVYEVGEGKFGEDFLRELEQTQEEA